MLSTAQQEGYPEVVKEKLLSRLSLQKQKKTRLSQGATAILLGWKGCKTGWWRPSDETDSAVGPLRWYQYERDGYGYGVPLSIWAPNAKIVIWYETIWKPNHHQLQPLPSMGKSLDG